MDVRKWVNQTLSGCDGYGDIADAFTPAITKLVDAAQACIEWEQEYRTLNHLGRNPPHPFKQLDAVLAEFEGRVDG